MFLFLQSVLHIFFNYFLYMLTRPWGWLSSPCRPPPNNHGTTADSAFPLQMPDMAPARLIGRSIQPQADLINNIHYTTALLYSKMWRQTVFLQSKLLQLHNLRLTRSKYKHLLYNTTKHVLTSVRLTWNNNNLGIKLEQSCCSVIECY